MNGDVENLILEHLRRFDRRLDSISSDLNDLKLRTTSIEQGLALVNQGVALVKQRIDRVEERLGRIERRLDLVDS
jgi:chromosome segregation ATPase